MSYKRTPCNACAIDFGPCTGWWYASAHVRSCLGVRLTAALSYLLTALYSVFSRVLLDDTISVHKANRARLIRVVGPFLGGKVDTQFLPAMENSTSASIVKSKEALFIGSHDPPSSHSGESQLNVVDGGLTFESPKTQVSGGNQVHGGK